MDNYDLLDPINYGNDGIIMLAKSKPAGNLVIVKEFQSSKFSEEYDKVVNEIKIQKSLDHLNVLKVLDHFEDDFLDYLAFPKFDCSLNDWIYADLHQKYNIADYLQQLSYQLLSGLNYIHNNKLIHRDLKPDNLLVNFNDFNIVISDFGNCIKSNKLGDNLDFGTLNYRAPELLLGFTNYNESIDLWALGCTLIEAYTKSILIEGDVELQVLNSIFQLLGTPKGQTLSLFEKFPIFREDSIVESEGIGLGFIKDEGFRELVEGLLKLNYSERIRAEEALKLDYLNNFNK